MLHLSRQGVNEDVKLIRTAAKKLSLTGALSVESLSSKTITVDGKPVGGGDAALKKRVEDLESALSTGWCMHVCCRCARTHAITSKSNLSVLPVRCWLSVTP